jgi:ribosome-binding protein aMBF1 (putative translation factor)
MKIAQKKLNRVQKSAKKLEWYTFDEVFKKDFKNKEFVKAYDEEMSRIKLARQIRENRLEKNLTQEAVALRAEMPQSVIARLESGHHSVSLDTLSKVAYALGKNIELS